MSNTSKYLKYFLQQQQENENNTSLHSNSRVLIVDGLNSFIRCYSANPTTNINGEHIGGLVGSLLSIGSAIKAVDPTRVIVVFDGKNGTARRRSLFADYKSQRKLKVKLNRSDSVDKQDNQLQQLLRLVQYLDKLPITTMILEGVEADDAIGYSASYLTEHKTDCNVTIMSSDKDFLQLVSDTVKVWSPTKKLLYDRDLVYQQYGIIPANFALYRSLIGDSSDNIPGVRGLGAKTALTKFPMLTSSSSVDLVSFFDQTKQLASQYPSSSLYKKVIQEQKLVETYYQVIQLKDLTGKESSLSSHDRRTIVNIVDAPIGELDKLGFYRLLVEDGANLAFRNPEGWIQDCMSNLHRFALQTGA